MTVAAARNTPYMQAKYTGRFVREDRHPCAARPLPIERSQMSILA
jgi:hypothetical protein